jgi:low affinity Fe/Cu permease
MADKRKQPKKRKKKEALSYRVTSWIGTPASLAVHTLFFATCIGLVFLGFEADQVMLVLTTIVSLEAIYLSILIQMSVNRSMESLREVEEDIEEIQEDVEELTEDIGEIQEDVEELTEERIEELKREAAKKNRSPIAAAGHEIGKVLSDLNPLRPRKRKPAGVRK